MGGIILRIVGGDYANMIDPKLLIYLDDEEWPDSRSREREPFGLYGALLTCYLFTQMRKLKFILVFGSSNPIERLRLVVLFGEATCAWYTFLVSCSHKRKYKKL